MKLSILGSSGGSVGALQSKLSGLHTNISGTIETLRNVKTKLSNVEGGGMEAASSNIQSRINAEQEKLEAVQISGEKLNTFLDNAVTTDQQVANQVNRNRQDFFTTNPWLRPVEAEEKSWWEKLVEDLKDFVKTAAEKIKETLGKIWEFLKEHAVEIIVGVVAIVIGAILTYLTGGAFLAALLAGFKAAAISALVSGAISGIIALFTGESFWEAFGDGLAEGFMWGGIFHAVSAFTKLISPLTSKITGKITQTLNKVTAKAKTLMGNFVTKIKTTFHSFGSKLSSTFNKPLTYLRNKVIAPTRARMTDSIAKIRAKMRHTYIKSEYQLHHAVPWKNKTYSPQYRSITDKYGINLKNWNVNIVNVPHKGRHPHTYHQFIMDRLQMIDNMSTGNSKKFQKYFKKYIIDPIVNDPDILYRK